MSSETTTFTGYTAPFHAQLSRHYVTVTDSLHHVICTFPRKRTPVLYRRESTVWMKAPYSSQEESVYLAATPEEAQELLDVLTQTLTHPSKLEEETRLWMGKTSLSIVIGIAVAVAVVEFVLTSFSPVTSHEVHQVLAVPSQRDVAVPQPVQLPPPVRVRPEQSDIQYDAPVQHLAPVTAQPSVGNPVGAPQPEQKPAPADSLTPEQQTALRGAMANNLQKADARGMFTVSLSSGHARTLYVFADPLCPNCRIFEPGLQAMSGYFNVKVFPVTLVGKGATVRDVAPVLCAPQETRSVLWRNIFSPDAGILHPEQNAQPQSCDAGRNALAINDRAFAVYRLPGTPTVIADDGRQVPLTAMKDIASLTAFLTHP
jgi:hypothetical protein